MQTDSVHRHEHTDTDTDIDTDTHAHTHTQHTHWDRGTHREGEVACILNVDVLRTVWSKQKARLRF